MSWAPQPTIRQRFTRAITVPALAGTVVLVAIVVASVFMVMIRPHGGANAAVESPPADPQEVFDQLPMSADQTVTHGASQSEEAAVTTVFVHVIGEVESPGVVELSADSRVEVAVEKAGGATADAVLAGVNLARIVEDGEQIIVPNIETAQVEQTGAQQNSGSATQPSTSMVNINTADESMLEMLPRVGPVLAAEIVKWRHNYGNFNSVDQLLEVPGIGAKTLENLRSLVRV